MASDDTFWRFIGPDGTRANSIATPPTNSCIPEVDKLPNSIGVGESASGLVILDLPLTTGTLILTPAYDGLLDDTSGWEWSF